MCPFELLEEENPALWLMSRDHREVGGQGDKNKPGSSAVVSHLSVPYRLCDLG